jgi:hypothetical protein
MRKIIGIGVILLLLLTGLTGCIYKGSPNNAINHPPEILHNDEFHVRDDIVLMIAVRDLDFDELFIKFGYELYQEQINQSKLIRDFTYTDTMFGKNGVYKSRIDVPTLSLADADYILIWEVSVDDGVNPEVVEDYIYRF